MFFIKRKNYTGRWIVWIIQAALIFGIVIYGIDVFNTMVEPEQDADIVVEQVQVQEEVVEVIIIERQVETQPEFDAVDYFYLALDHQQSGEYYDATADYTRAIELDPTIASSYLNRGVAYEQIGSNEYRAMSDFTQWMMRDNMQVFNHVTVRNSTDFTITMSESYRFDIPLALQDGEIVNLSAVSLNEDEVDPIIVLLDANGRPVAANDDVRRQDGSLVSMNSYIGQYEVSRSGEYTLMVTHAGGGSYGDVVVRVDIDN